MLHKRQQQQLTFAGDLACARRCSEHRACVISLSSLNGPVRWPVIGGTTMDVGHYRWAGRWTSLALRQEAPSRLGNHPTAGCGRGRPRDPALSQSECPASILAARGALPLHLNLRPEPPQS